jgi:hypothetical protein
MKKKPFQPSWGTAYLATAAAVGALFVLIECPVTSWAFRIVAGILLAIYLVVAFAVS